LPRESIALHKPSQKSKNPSPLQKLLNGHRSFGIPLPQLIIFIYLGQGAWEYEQARVAGPGVPKNFVFRVNCSSRPDTKTDSEMESVFLCCGAYPLEPII